MRKQLLRSSKLWAALALTATVIGVESRAGAQALRPVAGSSPVSNNSIPGQIVIKVPATMSDADVITLANSANCDVLRSIPYSPHYYVLVTQSITDRSVRTYRRSRDIGVSPTAATTAAVATLRATAGVAAIPNFVVGLRALAPPLASGPLAIFPNDPLYYPSAITSTGQTNNFPLVHMPQAWAVQSNTIGRTAIVAVCDTGIDPAHPDLINNIQPGGIDVTPTETGLTPSTTLKDLVGHGTFCSGIVAAGANNMLGVASVGGWARSGVSVKVLPVRVFDDSGNSTTDLLIAGINYAASQNVDVINLSLGITLNIGDTTDGLGTTADPLHAAVTAAYNSGVTIVAAVPDDPIDLGQFADYPSSYPEVIAVNAVGPDKELASYSAFGTTIAITAPGGDDPTFADTSRQILSTFPTTAAQAGFVADGYPPSPIAGYATAQGTSFACPTVAGACALLIEAGAARNPAMIKSILQATAQPLAGNTPDPTGGTTFGAGLLDVYAALASLPTSAPGFTAQFAEVDDTIYDPNGLRPTSVGTSTSGFSLVTDELFTQRGTTYVRPITPFAIRFVGTPVDTSGKVQPGYLTLQITPATIPTSILRSYTGGTTNSSSTFVLPALPSGASATTPLEVDVPSLVGITLPDGQYRAALQVYNPTTATTTEQGVIFFNTASQTQAAGRSMFASPFLVSATTVGSLPPELFEFGTSTNFTLARYNAQRLPTDLDYATYSPLPNATQNPQAEFVPPHAADGTPLATYTSDGATSTQPIGLGYWLDLTQSVTLNPTGPIATQAVSVKLFAANGGWNMVGTPFTYPINWASATVIGSNGTGYSLDGAVTAGIVSPTLVGYSGGEYVYSIEPAGTLAAFNGYWVQALQDCTIVFTPTGDTRSVGIGRAAALPATTALPAINGWRARLSATVAGDRDGENYFGIINDKTLPVNRYDIPKPPTGAGHAYVRFVKPDAAGKPAWFAEDLRPTPNPANPTQWSADISTDKSESKVMLTWDSIGNAPHDSELYLVDQATGKRIAMRSLSSYTFQSGEAGSTRHFSIVLEQGLSAGPLAVTNFSVMPTNRAVRSIGFRFTANQAADVTGAIRTLSGRVIANIGGTATRAAGSNETVLRWNGKKDDGTAVPAGTYFVEVTITNAKGETATVKRPFTSLF